MREREIYLGTGAQNHRGNGSVTVEAAKLMMIMAVAPAQREKCGFAEDKVGWSISLPTSLPIDGSTTQVLTFSLPGKELLALQQ